MKKKNILIIIVFIIILIVIALAVRNTMIQKVYTKHFSEFVEKYAEEYEVDPFIIYAMIKNESKFDEDAKSYKNAIGLMQILESTAEEVAKKNDINYENLNDPEVNIQIGILYFVELLEENNNSIELALASYNAGKNKVKSWIEEGIISEDGSNIENIPYKETNMYVRKIMRDYNIYCKLYSIK